MNGEAVGVRRPHTSTRCSHSPNGDWFPKLQKATPSPWGRGRGEGDRDAQKPRLSECNTEILSTIDDVLLPLCRRPAKENLKAHADALTDVKVGYQINRKPLVTEAKVDSVSVSVYKPMIQPISKGDREADTHTPCSAIL